MLPAWFTCSILKFTYFEILVCLQLLTRVLRLWEQIAIRSTLSSHFIFVVENIGFLNMQNTIVTGLKYGKKSQREGWE